MLRTGVPEVSCVKGQLVGLLYVLSMYGSFPYWHDAAFLSYANKLVLETIQWKVTHSVSQHFETLSATCSTIS